MTPRTVVGLDLSLTSTGLVALSALPRTAGEVLLAETIISQHRGIAHLVSRLDETQRELKRLTAPLVGPAFWTIEGYAYGATSRLSELAELGGIVKWWLYLERERFLVVPPARLKKFAAGRGNAPKDEMRLAVYKRWGFEHPSNDVVDAYALARLGLAVLGLDGGLTVEQRKVAEELGKQLETGEE